MKAKMSYTGQRDRAKKRGILFLLTFEEWYDWWLSNGVDKNLPAKPKSATTLCMCRFGDTGPYSLSNIYCDTISGNVSYGRKQKVYIGTGANPKPIMTPDGIFPSRKEAARFYGITGTSVGCRMKRHPELYYYL